MTDSHFDSPRWAETQSQEAIPILWCCVARDKIVLAQVFQDDDTKIPKVADRMMKKDAKTGWDYYTYAVQSQKRLVQAAKFHVYEKVPIPQGRRATLRGLEQNTNLNGRTVRILDYYAETDKYLIRPTVPLNEEEKLSTTGQLIVKAENLVADSSKDSNVLVWTFACLYDGNAVTQSQACAFVEKIMIISEDFRQQPTWKIGDRLACQKTFGPILQAQIEQFVSMGKDAFHDASLNYSSEIVAKNIELLSGSSF